MRFGIGGRKGMPMMSDKSLLDGGMLPGVLQDSGEEATDMAWHGLGRHACRDLCAADRRIIANDIPFSNGQAFSEPPSLDHPLD
jgi:hypothetical protein